MIVCPRILMPKGSNLLRRVGVVRMRGADSKWYFQCHRQLALPQRSPSAYCKIRRENRCGLNFGSSLKIFENLWLMLVNLQARDYLHSIYHTSVFRLPHTFPTPTFAAALLGYLYAR